MHEQTVGERHCQANQVTRGGNQRVACKSQACDDGRMGDKADLAEVAYEWLYSDEGCPDQRSCKTAQPLGLGFRV